MKPIILLISILFILFSCSTSNDVVSSRRIQKRKYNKGFYVKKHKKLKQSDKIPEEDLVHSNNIELNNEIAFLNDNEKVISKANIETIEVAKNKVSTIVFDKVKNTEKNKNAINDLDHISQESTNKNKENTTKTTKSNYTEDDYTQALYKAKRKVLTAIWSVFIPYVGFLIFPFQLFIGLGFSRIEPYISLFGVLTFFGILLYTAIFGQITAAIGVILASLFIALFLFNYITLIWELIILNRQIRES